MAIANVENGVAISYHGITIYHTYKNDYIDNGAREYWFTLNPLGSDDSEESFDVRELQGYDHEITASANLVRMIDNGLFGESNMIEHESTIEEDAYPPELSTPGHCPVCRAEIKDYGTLEALDNQVEYPFTCSNCGIHGTEWSALVFDGFTIP